MAERKTIQEVKTRLNVLFVVVLPYSSYRRAVGRRNISSFTILTSGVCRVALAVFLGAKCPVLRIGKGSKLARDPYGYRAWSFAAYVCQVPPEY
jgi:hypothetical protein